METTYLSRNFSTPPSPGDSLKLLREMRRDQTVRSGRAVDKPLILYGAGNLGHMALEYLEYVGIPVHAVVDTNARKIRQGAEWRGTRLLTPDEVTSDLQQEALLALCIVTAPYTPLDEELAAAGWKDIVPFYDISEHYRDRHPLSNGWFAAPFSAEDESALATVLQSWNDDVSRAHHLQFLAWRRLRQEWSFRDAPVNTGDRFFTPEMRTALGRTERFLDAGSHVGQVIKDFLHHTNGEFEHIWAIEPDAGNHGQLSNLLSDLDKTQRRKIDILPWALTDSDGERPFLGGLGYASQCTELSDECLPCRAIDSLGLAPSFIKLHLEGMELPALRGAVHTLHQHRPILTTTIYHNDDGLWRTPLWLLENLSGYVLSLRLHSWCGTGATIYACPEERLPATMAITAMSTALARHPKRS